MPRSKPTRDHIELGKKLKKVREDAGLTQIQAVKKLKKTQSYLSKVESGQCVIDVFELKHFAKIYKKSPTTFF